VLVVFGLLFMVTIYPLIMFVRQEPALSIMMSLYVTLGFLAAGSPRSVGQSQPDRFAAWSSFAHAALMAVQAYKDMISRSELGGALVVFGAALIVLAPAKHPVERASAAGT